MNQEKIGKFIKKLRTDNKLTQNEFANKLGVTYQAVSKWENGKNIPDMAILSEISKLFNVNIDDIINGNDIRKKNNRKNLIFIILIILLVILIVLLSFNIFNGNSKNDVKVTDITTKCDDFNVNGTFVYENNHVHIRISNIEHCGNNSEVYKKIECILYEKYNNTLNKISKCHTGYNETLSDHLKKVKLNADNYQMICHKFEDSKFYLEINATDKDDKITTFKVPLEVENTCLK